MLENLWRHQSSQTIILKWHRAWDWRKEISSGSNDFFVINFRAYEPVEGGRSPVDEWQDIVLKVHGTEHCHPKTAWLTVSVNLVDIVQLISTRGLFVLHLLHARFVGRLSLLPFTILSSCIEHILVVVQVLARDWQSEKFEKSPKKEFF